MKRSAILLGVKIVDIALQVARGQKNINDMGESGDIATVFQWFLLLSQSADDLMPFLKEEECGLKAW